jgi:hypothetical protein
MDICSVYTYHMILHMLRHPVVHMAPHMIFQMAPHTTLHMVPMCEMKFFHLVMDVLSITFSLKTILTVTVNRSRECSIITYFSIMLTQYVPLSCIL